MRTLMIWTALSLTACAERESRSGAAVGSASGTGSPTNERGTSASATMAGSAALGSAAPTRAASTTAAAAENDGADEVAQLVVRDVASPALGKQKIEASCVSVTVIPAGDWTVAAARLKDCGDKTARSIVWLFKRAMHGNWSEDYVGQPPRCWKGVPSDIAKAVTIATKIPAC